MAELSAETQAIIERLKAEGDLVRNSGTNSIRSVKIQLDRFEGVFNTISANVVEQTKILQMQAGLAQEAVEAQRTKEQFEELQKEKEEKIKTSDNGSETNKKIDDIGDKISSALSLKNLALAGAGIFVGYNLLKGFIDDRTDGGFSEMEETIANTDWSGLITDLTGSITDLSRITTSLSQINWEGLSTSINSMIEATTRFNEWLDGLPALLIGGGLVGTAARNFGQGLMAGGFGPRRAPPGAEAGPRGLGNIRGNVLMAVTGLAWVYGESIKTWLTEQGVPENVAGLGVDAAKAGMTGATIAMMFGLGPAGILIGAVAGLAWVAGNAFKNYLERRNAEAEQNFLDRYNQMGDVIEEAMKGNLTQEEIESLREMALEAGERIRNATNSTVRNALEAARQQIEDAILENVGNQEIGFFGRGKDFDEAFRAAFSRYYDIDPETGRSRGDASGIQAMIERIGRQYDEGSWADRILWGGDRDEFIQESLRQGLDSYFFDRSDPNRIQRLIPYDMMPLIRENLEGTFREGGRFHQFRTGTRGFMDFGDGQLSILHGREAVVPFNTAAGRFLDEYFTDNWEPRVANQTRMETVASGAAGGGAPVIINAPTTVSPNITNVEGSKSVNSMNVTTGRGGGGGGYHAYGLPLGVN